MLQHAGSEFGYLIEGELEITVGFEVFMLDAGEAFGFDSLACRICSRTAPTGRHEASGSSATSRT